MFTDLKYALRGLAKRPSFSAIAILILALGIGANTAIFSVVEGTLLRPLPFSHPERLVRIFEAQDERGARGASTNLSDQTVQRWREFGHDIFEDIGAATGGASTVGLNDGSPVQTVPASRISSNFFSVLGLPPAQGRTFTLEEDREGGPAVVMISHDFWRNNLNARSDVLGSSVVVDGQRRTVIGVMPKSFRHPYRASLWLPLALPPVNAATANSRYLYGVGRLRPGITAAQAQDAVRRMCAAINQADPNPANPRAAYLPRLRESFVMDLRPKILVIIGAAFCAFLIAAANFAGLLLSRVVEREGEFALRSALGASRRRIIRQELVQALVLAAIGTAFGLLVALWTTPALVAMSPEGSDATGSAMREFDYTARLDLPVFAFAAGAMVLTGLGFGLLPAARASRTDLRSAMNAVSRSATLNRSTRRLLGSFVVIQLAFAAALLTASLTATQFFWKLVDEPWGFETQGRIAFNVTVPDQNFSTAKAKENALDATLAQLRQLPGVTSATLTSPSPMNASWNLMPFNPENAPAPEPRGFYFSYSRAAVPGYFKSIGQPLLQGRANGHLAAYNIVSLEDAAAQSRTTERFIFVLLSSFGLLGLLLAAVGLYGLLSLQVARREREFGIRSALGATAAQIIHLVAKQGARLLAAGFVAGAITTWAIFRLVQSQWTEMPTPNLFAWVGGGAVLAITIAIACLLPARRASRVDPIVVLRYE